MIHRTTIVYEMQKRGDGFYQWRRKDEPWHIADNMDEMLTAIRVDAATNDAHFQVRYTGTFC